MLPKQHRLRVSADIKRVLARGQRFTTNFFVMHAFRSKNAYLRIAFVVSNKVGKRASTRNLLRRRMRATMQAELKTINFGVDVVVVARTSAIKYISEKQRGKRTPLGMPIDSKTISHDFSRFLVWLKS